MRRESARKHVPFWSDSAKSRDQFGDRRRWKNNTVEPLITDTSNKERES
jgi:hypothetical protein